jgi:hypothetical protein
MNDYVMLDGNKYKAIFGQWAPERAKPSKIRMTLSGGVDAVYGPGVFKRWAGVLIAVNDPVKIADGFGSREDLEAAYDKARDVAFVDHEGDAYNVHMMGTLKQRQLTPVTDSDNNRFHYSISMVKA